MKTTFNSLQMRCISVLLFIAFGISATATTAQDTTIVVDNKKIEIKTDNGKTDVAIYESDGNKLVKTSHSTFAPEQEVEQVYVSSPIMFDFFVSKRQVAKNAKNRSWWFYARTPKLFFGKVISAPEIMQISRNEELHSRDSKSWEWGLTLTHVALDLSNKRVFGLSSAIQLSQVHHHFKTNHIMTNDGDNTVMQHVPDMNLKKSYISYNIVRLPIHFELHLHSFHFSIGGSLDYRFTDRARYITNDKRKKTITKDINMKPLAINVEANIGFGTMCLYIRQSLTPLMETDIAPTCYPLAIGIGFLF